MLLEETFKQENLCGYCGVLCGKQIRLVKSIGSGKTFTESAALSCAFYVKFSLASVTKSSKNYPTTNRPIKCDKFPIILWSYNLALRFSRRF